VNRILAFLFLGCMFLTKQVWGVEANAQAPAVFALIHDPAHDHDTLELSRLLQQALGEKALGRADLRRRLSGVGPSQVSEAQAKNLQQHYEQAFLQTYSFEYKQAIRSLQDLQSELDMLPPGPLRWSLFVKSHIALGMAMEGAKNRTGAIQAFAAVLRTRPDMELSRREYSTKTIQLWNLAAKRLDALNRGSLAVDCDPHEAELFLDGVRVGTTPYLGTFAMGRYYLQAKRADGSSAERWVNLGPRPTRLSLRLLKEPELLLDGLHPALLLPAGQKGLPGRWWDWLSRRLGGAKLILVERNCPKTGCEFRLRLVDPISGHSLRHARLTRVSPEQLPATAISLAEYLVDGRPSGRLEPAGRRPEDEPEAGHELSRQNEALVPVLPELEAFADIQPWHQRWWPYAIGSAGLVGLAVAAQFGHARCQDAAEEALTLQGVENNQQLADLYLGLAITGYTLAAASLVTGLVLEWTFESELTEHQLGLHPGPDGSMGITWTTRF